jgi:hypothetical protein
MQRASQAVIVILGWCVGIISTLLFAPFSQIALGIVIGAVATAAVLGLAVKLSIDGLFQDTAASIDSMNESLANKQSKQSDDREQPDIETQTAFKGGSGYDNE